MSRARTFGLVLRQWRNQAGLSLRELQDAVGRSAGHLSRIERGHVPPPRVDELDKLAVALGVPNEVIYEAAGRPSAGDDQRSAAEAFGQAVTAWRDKAGMSLDQARTPPASRP